MLIDLLKKFDKGVRKMTNFKNFVLEPLSVAIKNELKHELVKTSGPFGLGAVTNITSYKNKSDEGNYECPDTFYCSLEYHSNKEKQTRLFVRDYSTNTGKYKADSIGAMNGMNHPLVDITDKSIPEIIEFCSKK